MDTCPSETDDWRDGAPCRGRTELFYDRPKETPVQRLRRVAEARVLCATCPSIDICRMVGRMNREHGIWGGETDEERAAAGFLPLRSTSRRIRAAWRPHRLERSDSGHTTQSDTGHTTHSDTGHTALDDVSDPALDDASDVA